MPSRSYFPVKAWAVLEPGESADVLVTVVAGDGGPVIEVDIADGLRVELSPGAAAYLAGALAAEAGVEFG